jgi:hypothetical protein
MATIRSEDFQRRARRAYELARLRHGVAKIWPILLMTGISCWVCHEPDVSIAIGVGLAALAIGFAWYGRVAGQAANAGLKVGAVAFAVPVLAFHWYFVPHCCTSLSVWLVNIGCGFGAGVWLSLRSTRLQAQRNAFLLLAGLVATLCGMLGCILFGPIGLAGMVAGIALSTAPVAIYRRATA